jgi:hypothetical protein
MKKQFVNIEKLETDGLQTRAALNMDAVREYAEQERAGKKFPPVTVFRDSRGLLLVADGFHRLAAARQNGRTTVACEVHEGEFADALRHALGANQEHGLRRTNEDKKHAVLMAYERRKTLGLPEVPSASLIAEMVGVHHTFAAGQLATVAGWKNAQERTGADGRTRSLPPTRPHEKAVLPPPPERPTAHPTRPPVRPVEAPEPPVERAPRRTVETPLDGRGKPVPPGLVELWSRRDEVATIAQLISKARCAIREAQQGDDPLWGEINFSSVLSHLDMAFAETAAAEPWCTCPSCQGIGCKFCKGRGLMSKYRFDNVVPRELK